MPRPSGLSVDLDLEPRSAWRSVDFINTGVPHVVVRVDDLETHPVVEEGRLIRYHERFAPEGTNANFMSPAGPNLLEVRTGLRDGGNRLFPDSLREGAGQFPGACEDQGRRDPDHPLRETGG